MLRNGYLVPLAHIVRKTCLEVADITLPIGDGSDSSLEMFLRAKAADDDVVAIAVATEAEMTIQSNSLEQTKRDIIQVIVQRRWVKTPEIFIGAVSRDSDGRVLAVFDEAVSSGIQYGGRLSGLFETR
jgi:hypothetical protein